MRIATNRGESWVAFTECGGGRRRPAFAARPAMVGKSEENLAAEKKWFAGCSASTRFSIGLFFENSRMRRWMRSNDPATSGQCDVDRDG